MKGLCDVYGNVWALRMVSRMRYDMFFSYVWRLWDSRGVSLLTFRKMD